LGFSCRLTFFKYPNNAKPCSLAAIPFMRSSPFTVIIAFAIQIFGCVNRGVKPTSGEFVSKVVTDSSSYLRDKRILSARLETLLNENGQSFYSKEYSRGAQVYIDTILYAPSHNQIALFAITKNPTSRQLQPNKHYQWYYDAYCYLGKRDADTFDIRWLSTFSCINYYDSSKVSKRIRKKYFYEFAALKDVDSKPLYGVNLDDKRFWTNRIWKKLF